MSRRKQPQAASREQKEDAPVSARSSSRAERASRRSRAARGAARETEGRERGDSSATQAAEESASREPEEGSGSSRDPEERDAGPAAGRGPGARRPWARRERPSGRDAGEARSACCIVSELLEESGIDRERIRQVRRQVLQGIMLLCQWQLQRMEEARAKATAADANREASSRRGRSIKVE